MHRYGMRATERSLQELGYKDPSHERVQGSTVRFRVWEKACSQSVGKRDLGLSRQP